VGRITARGITTLNAPKRDPPVRPTFSKSGGHSASPRSPKPGNAKYKVGELVNYLGRERASGVYRVTQLLPQEGQAFQSFVPRDRRRLVTWTKRAPMRYPSEMSDAATLIATALLVAYLAVGCCLLLWGRAVRKRADRGG
jgi:hypothetical protein